MEFKSNPLSLSLSLSLSLNPLPLLPSLINRRSHEIQSVTQTLAAHLQQPRAFLTTFTRMKKNIIIFIIQQTFLKSLSIMFSDSRTSRPIVIRNASSIIIRATKASYPNKKMNGHLNTNDTRQRLPLAIVMSERVRNSRKRDMVWRISNIQYRIFGFEISNIKYRISDFD